MSISWGPQGRFWKIPVEGTENQKKKHKRANGGSAEARLCRLVIASYVSVCLSLSFSKNRDCLQQSTSYGLLFPFQKWNLDNRYVDDSTVEVNRSTGSGNINKRSTSDVDRRETGCAIYVANRTVWKL